MLRRVPAAGAVSALSVRRFDVDLTDLVSFVPIQSSRLLWTFHAGFFALFRTFVRGWPGGGGQQLALAGMVSSLGGKSRRAVQVQNPLYVLVRTRSNMDTDTEILQTD